MPVVPQAQPEIPIAASAQSASLVQRTVQIGGVSGTISVFATHNIGRTPPAQSKSLLHVSPTTGGGGG